MKTFAIIVIYNGMRRDWIKKCFSSIENSTIPVQIIAIDNNSTDDSVDFIKNHFPKTTLIVAGKNLGFGGANNLGIETALKMGGEYFFLLNQDAWVEPNTIEKLVNQAKQNPEYGIISPLHYNGKGNALDFNFSNQISPSRCHNLYSDFVLSKVEDKIYNSGFICAAAWLFTKKSIEMVGGFSPTFFHYGEDDNYVHRLLYKGLKIGIYPHTHICHDREERTENSYFEKEETKERNFLITYSDPRKALSIEKEIKKLKIKLLIYKLFFNKDAQKFIQKDLDLRLKYQNIIESNLQKTKSNDLYTFINYEE